MRRSSLVSGMRLGTPRSPTRKNSTSGIGGTTRRGSHLRSRSATACPYTTFTITNLVVTPNVTDGHQPVQVRFVVENTGKRQGAEVAQVYLGLPSVAGEPPRRLVGFEKVALAPGEKKQIQITIDPGATNHPLGYWNSASQRWTVADGAYTVYVGNSSRHALLKDAMTVRGAQAQQR